MAYMYSPFYFFCSAAVTKLYLFRIHINNLLIFYCYHLLWWQFYVAIGETNNSRAATLSLKKAFMRL